MQKDPVVVQSYYLMNVRVPTTNPLNVFKNSINSLSSLSSDLCCCCDHYLNYQLSFSVLFFTYTSADFPIFIKPKKKQKWQKMFTQRWYENLSLKDHKTYDILQPQKVPIWDLHDLS